MWLVVGREKPDNPDQSTVRKARASSKGQAGGGLGEGGWGSADNPDQSAVREIRHRNRNGEDTGTRRGGQARKKRKGVRVALTNLTSLRSERPGTTREGFEVGQAAKRVAKGEQKGREYSAELQVECWQVLGYE